MGFDASGVEYVCKMADDDDGQDKLVDGKSVSDRAPTETIPDGWW